MKSVANWCLRGLAAALLLSATGCSFVFVRSPPSAEEREERRGRGKGDCTTSRAAPIVDTVIGGYQVFRTGYALSADESVYEGAPITRETDVVFGVGLTALFLGSAIYGYSKTSQCEEWKRKPQQWGEADDWAE